MNVQHLALVAVFAAAGLPLSACGSAANPPSGGTTPASSSAPTSPTATATVSAQKGALGTYLVDAERHTLYLLTADRPGQRVCTGSCLQYWPPVMVSGSPTAAAGVTATLGVLSVAGGEQLTVNGYPAYTYAGDSSAGQANGQGIKSFGGNWWVFSSSGTPITKSAPTTGSGNGY